MNIRKITVIILCGLVTGTILYIIKSILLGAFAQEAMAILGTYPYQKFKPPYFLTLDVLMGIWAVWLYSLTSNNLGNYPQAAFVIGFIWWSMKTLQSGHWVGLGVMPFSTVMVAPGIISLVTVLLGILVGAYLYQKVMEIYPEKLSC